MAPPRVSICILSLNRRKEILFVLKKIFSNNYKNIEVIVVDNASTDGTPLFIRKKFKEVKLITLKKNIGIAGWNLAFKKSKGKYVLFLDDDSYPGKDAISAACGYLEQNENISAIMMNIYLLNKKKKFTPFFSLKQPKESAFFIGCGVMFRSKDFRRLTGYCSNYFLYGNEWELSIRLYDLGGKIVFLPNAPVYHLYSPVNRTNERRIFYGVRNSIWTILKNYPIPLVPPLLSWALIREFAFALKTNNLGALFGGIYDAFKNLYPIIKKRKPTNYSGLLRFYKSILNFYRASG